MAEKKRPAQPQCAELPRRPTRPCKPLFEVVPLLPGFLFRSRLMNVIKPMLPAHVGLVARIKALLSRPFFVAGRTRVVSPKSCVGSARATLVFPSGNGAAILVVVVIFHLVVAPVFSRRLPRFQEKLDGRAHRAER